MVLRTALRETGICYRHTQQSGGEKQEGLYAPHDERCARKATLRGRERALATGALRRHSPDALQIRRSWRRQASFAMRS